MNNENLNGTLVLVRPDLTIDPADGQGKVAVVTYDWQQSNEIYVNFANGREGIYPPEFLLKLKDRQDILSDLKKDGASMPLDSFKDLYKVGMLLDRGTSTGQWQALEIAGKNPAIWGKALQPVRLEEKLSLEKAFTR